MPGVVRWRACARVRARFFTGIISVTLEQTDACCEPTQREHGRCLSHLARRRRHIVQEVFLACSRRTTVVKKRTARNEFKKNDDHERSHIDRGVLPGMKMPASLHGMASPTHLVHTRVLPVAPHALGTGARTPALCSKPLTRCAGPGPRGGQRRHGARGVVEHREPARNLVFVGYVAENLEMTPEPPAYFARVSRIGIAVIESKFRNCIRPNRSVRKLN